MDKDDYVLWLMSQMSDDELDCVDKMQAELQSELDRPVGDIGDVDFCFW